MMVVLSIFDDVTESESWKSNMGYDDRKNCI